LEIEKMFRSLLLLSSVALLPASLGSKVCPVSFHESWPNGAKGNIDIVVNADEKEDKSNWSGWKIVLTFDRPVQHINTGQGKDNRCDGMKCEFVTRNWIPKQAKLDLRFDINFQTSRSKFTASNVVSVKIASTEKDEKNRIYHEMCTELEQLKQQTVEKVVPPCDTDFVKIKNVFGNNAGYSASMYLVSPSSTQIVNYGVKIKMSNPFYQVNVYNAKNPNCDKSTKTCTFRNHEGHANAALVPGNPPKEFGFQVDHPTNKPSYIDEMIVEGKTICKN